MIDNPLIIAAVVVAALLVLGMGIALYSLQRSLAKLHASFAKLGYANREDAKKYFEETAERVAEMNKSFYQQHQKMIEDGVRKVLSESSLVVEETLLKAHQDSGEIIIKAQQEGQQILESTRKNAELYYDRAIDEAVDTLQWTLEQYLMGHMDIKQHEEVITKLVSTYVNERRPK
ncbi:MAG: hypothetical protein JWP13_915 [Candidatus Saccharibacteria bacterium]|nr:hypothetical protein [Candidatus Saccharibacteria bacterium]